jgi:hypothetical protein
MPKHQPPSLHVQPAHIKVSSQCITATCALNGAVVPQSTPDTCYLPIMLFQELGVASCSASSPDSPARHHPHRLAARQRVAISLAHA